MFHRYENYWLHCFVWTIPLTGTSASVSASLVTSYMCFSLSLRRVYVINKEVCVRTVCAHEELLRGGFTLLSYCVLCVCFGSWGLSFELLCLCVFSGPVPRPVLSLWCGGAERPVFITRRKLWEELRWLLMEDGDQGCYLPRYCRFS